MNWVHEGALPIVRRESPAAREVRSVGGRPVSLVVTLESDLMGGVEKRILRLVVRKKGVETERERAYLGKVERVRCRSSVSWSWLVTVHLAPRQLWLIDLGRVFKGFPGYSGLPSNGICDSLQA